MTRYGLNERPGFTAETFPLRCSDEEVCPASNMKRSKCRHITECAVESDTEPTEPREESGKVFNFLPSNLPMGTWRF